MSLFRTKPIDVIGTSKGLHRCLSAFDLTLLGVGAIIGAGIFVLTGIAAATKAGPAIIISYILAGSASALSALCYAELAASIGGCGSAYGYAYAGFGEIIAWIIGWDLLLEYGISCSAVANGWSGYVNNGLTAMGLHIPTFLLKSPLEGGIINLPAALIVLVIMFLLARGVRESTRFNAVMVFLKLSAIAIFVAVASFHVNPSNWHPFMPFGWNGVVGGAALIFFAYIGFDAVSTAADEAIRPERDLPIGIIASLIICTAIYVLVAALLTGVVPYTTLNVSSPVADVLLNLGHRFGAGMVAAGAIAGLTTVILVMYYGLTRIMLAMAGDGLLSPSLTHIDAKKRTPTKIIYITGVLMAALSGLLPIGHLAELVNIGTLAAFVVVCCGVIFLRYTRPDIPRPFKVPFSPVVPAIGVIFCIYLMTHLTGRTWIAFSIWSAVGLIIYFCYSRKRSALAIAGQ